MDPSGEWIFTFLTGIIPGAQFLLPYAIALDISWMAGGFISVNQGKSFWYGAWRGALTGGLTTVMAPIRGAGMSFVSNIIWGSVQGSIIGGVNALSGVMTLTLACCGVLLQELFLPLLNQKTLRIGLKVKVFIPMKMSLII